MNRKPPIHRSSSVPRSTSAMIPNDCERNERNRSSPWLMDTRSRGFRIDLMIDSVAAETSPVPARFQHMAFPDPQGSWQTAMRLNALISSSCFAKPLKTSLATPSPEQHITASYASISIFFAISIAWPWYSVVSTSTVQFAASRRGRLFFSNSCFA